MSIYHCSIKIISRAGGRSAVASAAYRSGEKFYNDETGIVHDFTRKGGVVYTEIMLPANAPTKYLNREILWNEVQKIEKRSDAQFAREVEVAFPKELTREEQLKCVKTFIDKNFVSEGMIADFAIHDTGKGNPHAHIMLTVRGIDENEEWMQKQRTVFANTRDKNEVPIYDPMLPSYDAKNKEATAKYRIPALDKNGKQKTRVRKGKGTEYLWEKISIPVNDWNEHANAEKWRASWAEECNRFLSIENQIDHRSYERQGLEMEPTVHEGIIARNMEKKGKVADRCGMNREIKERNLLRAQIRKLATEITNIIIQKARLIYERVRELTGHIGDAGKTAGVGGSHGRVTDTVGRIARREASNFRRNGNLEGRQGSFTGRNSGFDVGKRTVSGGTGRSNKFKQSIQQSSNFIEKSEREIADTDRRIEEVTRQIKKKEEEQNSVLENLWNADELLQVMEEQQDEIDKLKGENHSLSELNLEYQVKEKNFQCLIEQSKAELKEAWSRVKNLKNQNLQLQQRTSDLSSQNSLLKSEVQKKSDTIVEKNNELQELSGADMKLQQARQLASETMLWKKSLEMKEVKVKQREEAVIDKEIQSAILEAENIKKANSLREEKRSMEARIKKTADNLVKDEIQNLKASYIRKEVDLEHKYNMKYMAVRGLIFLIMMYGIITTTFTGLLDYRFREDMIIFLSVIWKFLKGVYAVASGLGGLAWSLKDRIPYDYVNIGVAGILTGLSYIAVFGFVFGIIGYVIYHIMKFYVEEFWDLISLGVTLGTLALLVWYGEWIGIAFLINLVVLWIVLQFIYVIGRMIIFRDKRRW